MYSLNIVAPSGSDEISLNDYAVHVPRGSIISFLVVWAVIKAMHHMCWPADIIVYLKNMSNKVVKLIH